jgi:hypothetical protein
MAQQVPLNHFERVSVTLGTTLSQVYSAPVDTAAIMLSILASNTSSNPTTITLGISGNGGPNVPTKPFSNIVKNFSIPGNDTTNVAVGKIVLMNYDVIIANCVSSNTVDLTLSILETLNTTTT